MLPACICQLTASLLKCRPAIHHAVLYHCSLAAFCTMLSSCRVVVSRSCAHYASLFCRVAFRDIPVGMFESARISHPTASSTAARNVSCLSSSPHAAPWSLVSIEFQQHGRELGLLDDLDNPEAASICTIAPLMGGP
jgi:hypothetical protein